MSLLLEEQDRLLDDIHSLILGKYVVQRCADPDLLSPAATDGDLVAKLAVGHRIEGARADAEPAVVANIPINVHDILFYCTRLHGAGKDNRAFCASFAEIAVVLRYHLADDADIVEIRLDAVVRAAADGDLEFVRQGDLAKALIKALVDFGRQSLCIDVAK